MTTGLVGHTGFVGGNIARQRRIDRGFRRADIEGIRGQSFQTLWLSGAPAQKWVANNDPEGDAAALTVLTEHLRHVQAATVVLVSTVDVYPIPASVDEDVEVDLEAHPEAYGRNRLRFERDVQSVFPHALVVRLPGLYGPGLKKNLVYDLVHGREEFAHRDSIFQFYDVTRLCDDVDTALEAGIRVLNVATEPVSAQDVAREVFARQLHREEGAIARYDMRTKHAHCYDVQSDYLIDRASVLAGMRRFVRAERQSA